MAANESRTRVAIFSLIAALAVIAVVLLWLMTRAEPEVAGEIISAPPPIAIPDPIAPARAVVASVIGEVEQSTKPGTWHPINVGDELQSNAALRTGVGARADLAIGEDATIAVEEDSQVAVVEVTDAVRRLQLRSGRLSVRHSGTSGRVLRIEDDAGGVVEARAASFDVANTGTSLAVAASKGSVKLTSGGTSVDVAAGQTSLAERGAAPAAPVAIPTELILRIARSTAKGVASLCATVRGNASPAAEVTVEGVRVQVAEDGSFSREVPRRPGVDRVPIVIRDALGRTKQSNVPCTTPPSKIEDLQVQWGASP